MWLTWIAWIAISDLGLQLQNSNRPYNFNCSLTTRWQDDWFLFYFIFNLSFVDNNCILMSECVLDLLRKGQVLSVPKRPSLIKILSDFYHFVGWSWPRSPDSFIFIMSNGQESFKNRGTIPRKGSELQNTFKERYLWPKWNICRLWQKCKIRKTLRNTVFELKNCHKSDNFISITSSLEWAIQILRHLVKVWCC